MFIAKLFFYHRLNSSAEYNMSSQATAWVKRPLPGSRRRACGCTASLSVYTQKYEFSAGSPTFSPKLSWAGALSSLEPRTRRYSLRTVAAPRGWQLPWTFGFCVWVWDGDSGSWVFVCRGGEAAANVSRATKWYLESQLGCFNTLGRLCTAL